MIRKTRLAGWRWARLLRQLAEEPVYLATHLLPRDPRVWLFGYNRGFGGNARYLAEYLHDAGLGVQPWWLARSSSEAVAARRSGIPVAMRYRRQGIQLQLRAGVAVVSGGLSDLPIAARAGSYVVNLFHGIPIKRIELDDDTERRMAGPYWLRRLRGAIVRWERARAFSRVDMIVAPSELARSRFLTAFGVPPSRVHVLGTPRFDVLHGGTAYERVAGGDVRARLGLRPSDYVLLWLPTWRERADDTWLPALEWGQVDKTLGGTEVVLVVKPHPFSDHSAFKRWLPGHPQVRLLDQAVDPNVLLRVADAMVSDYSSAVFDYAILERPIYFLTPDLEDYVGHDRDLYEPLDTITGGRQFREWNSLLSTVVAGARGETTEGVATARHIGALSMSNDEPGSCARIVAAIAASIGLTGVAEQAGFAQSPDLQRIRSPTTADR